MKKRALYSVAAVSVLFGTLAPIASARDFDGIYTECGLGGMIATNKPGLASFTNVTWDSGSTAISSNISSPDTCEGGKAKKVSFIHSTYPLLEKEIARGEGKHLTALLAIAGCSSSAQADVARALRNDLSVMVNDPAYSTQTRYEQARALYERFNERLSSDFPKSCTNG